MESDEGAFTSEDELRQNTKGNTGSTRSNALLRTQMPPNPFRKTLVSEPEEISSTAVGERPAEPLNRVASGTKPLYDVDDFKRLLLTGERNASHAGAVPTPAAHDNGNNTDTSSISRQSIFEPLPENHQDTPRTSHEVSQSEDERQGLAHDFPGGEARIRPSVPVSHYGKPVKGNTLQTKSLHDSVRYSQSLVTGSAISNHQSKQSVSQSPTDLNKPLPLPPTSAFSGHPPTDVKSPISSIQQDNLSLKPPQTQENDNLLKKSPPALPLARRRSQIRQNPIATSSERPTSTIEVRSKEPDPYSGTFAAPGPKLPPPPPPRRHDRARGLSVSSTSSALSFASTTLASSSVDDQSLKSPKIRPPLPPARTPSIKKPPRLITSSKSPSMAPPPTPPRGRGSSQSSLTSLQTGGDYHTASTDRQRNDSGASLTLPPTASIPETDSREKDVLADLSVLQREVDELRGKLNQ